MAPIRVGIIGLSTTSDGTDWAAQAHLPYLQSSPKYEIIALCNSTIDKAEASIERYKLPASTRAYGSPTDLAEDADIDLVVCVVGVTRHYEVLKPSLMAGKDIYTELPLAQGIDQMRELEALAREKGVRTMFGMQGQANPVVNTVKCIIDEGRIGKVLSTTVTAYAGRFGGVPTPKQLAQIHLREEGSDFMTVWVLHSLNFILHALGELASFSSMLGILHPQVTIFDPSTPDNEVIGTITATSPDHVSIQGRLQSDALLTYHLEGGEPFPGEPGLNWHIVCEEGELLITNPTGLMDVVHVGAKIMLKKAGSKTASEVEFLADTDVDKLQHPAQNVGRLYEAFADKKSELYADWKLALRRHELLDEIYQRWDKKEAPDRQQASLELGQAN